MRQMSAGQFTFGDLFGHIFTNEYMSSFTECQDFLRLLYITI